MSMIFRDPHVNSEGDVEIGFHNLNLDATGRIVTRHDDEFERDSHDVLWDDGTSVNCFMSLQSALRYASQ